MNTASSRQSLFPPRLRRGRRVAWLLVVAAWLAMPAWGAGKQKWQVVLERDFLRAVYQGNRARAMELIGYGAPLNARNEAGNTALHLAALAGDKEMLRLLLDHGADKNLSNKAGDNPMDVAATKGRHDLVFLIRTHRASGPLPPSDGEKPAAKPPRPVVAPAAGAVKAVVEGPRLVLPGASRGTVLLSLNNGQPIDLNLGRGLVRLSAMIRLDRKKALALGFVATPDPKKPAAKVPFGHAEAAFWAWDRKILLAVQEFLSRVSFDPKRPARQGNYLLRWPTQGGGAVVIPMTREDLSRRLLGYLQDDRGLGWVQEVIFTRFITTVTP